MTKAIKSILCGNRRLAVFALTQKNHYIRPIHRTFFELLTIVTNNSTLDVNLGSNIKCHISKEFIYTNFQCIIADSYYVKTAKREAGVGKTLAAKILLSVTKTICLLTAPHLAVLLLMK